MHHALNMSQHLLLSVIVAVLPQTLSSDDPGLQEETQVEPFFNGAAEYLSLLLVYEEFCDPLTENCALKGIYFIVGFLCIVNAAIILTILVMRQQAPEKMNHSKNGYTSNFSTSKTIDTAICRLAAVISVCCIVESVLVDHFKFPLSLMQCRCDDDKKMTFLFCQLSSSLLVVITMSLLGSLAWFSSFTRGIMFIILTVTCHTISNLLALLFIASPRQIMCNSTMQRVTTTFVMYSAILFGVLLVRIFHRKNMQIISVASTNEPLEDAMSSLHCGRKYDSSKTDQEDNDESVIVDASKDIEDDEFEESPGYRRDKGFPFSPKYPRKKHPLSRFGTDAFLPCVVLMRKKVRTSPIHANVSNIGISATKPPFRHTHRRASLGVIKERNLGGEEASWARMSQRRRTSLPTAFHSSRKQTVMSSVLVETTVIAQLHSTLDELSIASSNDPVVSEYAAKLQQLLKPYKSENLRPSQVVWLHDSISSTSDGSDDEDCFRGSRINFSKRVVNRRPEWPNQDGSVWTTTTSATGLPSQDPGPVKSKRLPKIQKTPSNTPHDSRCNSPVCGKDNLARRRTIHSIGPLHSPARNQSFFSQEDSNMNNSDSKDVRKRSLSQSAFPSSDYESCDNNFTDGSEGESRHSGERSLSLPTRGQTPDGLQQSSARRSAAEGSHLESDQMPKIRMLITEPTIDEGSEEEERLGGSDSCHSRNSSVSEMSIPDGQAREQSLMVEKVQDYFVGIEYKAELLEKVYNWNFPIFELADQTHCVLSQMSYKLFDDTGLFESFKIPRNAFVTYMRALENGYRNIPYHNRIHASDVLHGCWFLTTQQIPGFTEISPLFSSDSSDSDSGTAHTQVNTVGNGSLAQAIPALELMALYLAAAMHDYDHPGRTNAFLVETRHPLAMLYNDRSVLENHHASASWELLYSRKDGLYDFLVNLDIAEWKRLRFLIVEAILATDLKKHFELMARFSSKLTRRNDTGSEVDEPPRHEGFLKWTADEDRLLVCQMIIKLADIGGPTKVRDLHVTWTRAICQEFFTQGDEERHLTLPVSPFMDREKPQVAQLQKTFIKNLIAPLVCKMHRAGILAGYADDHEDKDGEENILEPTEDKAPGTCRSLIREQLADNLRYWHSVLQRELPGQEEMEEVFFCAHDVVLEHAQTSETEPSQKNLPEKNLNNCSMSNCDVTDEPNKLIVTSNPKDKNDKRKNETKIPGFTRNFLSRPKTAGKSESKTSHVPCNTTDNKNKSKLPRIST